MPKGSPIFIKRVPWHDPDDPEDLAASLREADEDLREGRTVPLSAITGKCCGQGCSRCMRKKAP